MTEIQTIDFDRLHSGSTDLETIVFERRSARAPRSFRSRSDLSHPD